MVAHVLRLRIALLAGAFRGDRRHVIRMVVVSIVLLAAVVAASVAILSLENATTEVAFAVTAIGGSAVLVGFAVAPLLAAVDDPLDPRRFTVFGFSTGPLAAATAVAGLVSVPIAVLAVLGLCLVSVWVAHGVALPLALFGMILSLLTCSLASRVGFALAALVLRNRGSRELTGVLIVALLVVVVPTVVFLTSLNWSGDVPDELLAAANALTVTPIGAAGGIPGLSATGGAVTTAVLTALATLTVLYAIWHLLVKRMLTHAATPLSARERSGLGWVGVMPGTGGGAIAARSLIYWFRDRRYVANIVIIPVFALLATLPLLIAGVPAEIVALIPVPLMALFFGWLPHNDLAYDSTAVWMHVASGVRGISDRVGRLVPVLAFGVPTLAVAIPVAVAAHGDWHVLPAMIGLCASLFFAGLGLSSVSSVAAPYAVSRPGDSAFQQPQRTGGSLAQAVVLVGAVLVSIPSLQWGWQAITVGVDSDLALWGGVGIGVLVLFVGLVIGSIIFDRRGGWLMEFAEST